MTEHVFPLGVDLHVHFRTPGSGTKETLATGYEAAVSGGIGTVVDMPNTNPPLDNTRELRKKFDLLRDYPFIHQFGAMTDRNVENREIVEITEFNPLLKVYLANSTGDLGISKRTFRQALNLVEEMKPLIFIHAEDPDLIHPRSKSTSEEQSRPKEAEIRAVDWVIKMARDYPKITFHVTHVSTPEAAELLINEKMSWDVLAKHLHFNSSQITKTGNYAIMNPPLREEQDRKRLYEYFRDGKIPIITSDHAPHTKGEKRNIISGAPGVQELYRYLLGEFAKESISRKVVEDMIHKNPKSLLNKFERPVREGKITFEDTSSYIFTEGNILSKSGWSLWEKEALQGDITQITLSQ